MTICEIIEARAREAAGEIADRIFTGPASIIGSYQSPLISDIIRSALIAILTDPAVGFKEALIAVDQQECLCPYDDCVHTRAEAKLAELKEIGEGDMTPERLELKQWVEKRLYDHYASQPDCDCMYCDWRRDYLLAVAEVETLHEQAKQGTLEAARQIDALTAEIATLKGEVERLKKENRRRAACDLVNDRLKRSLDDHKERVVRMELDYATLRTHLQSLVEAAEKVLLRYDCTFYTESINSAGDVDRLRTAVEAVKKGKE